MKLLHIFIGLTALTFASGIFAQTSATQEQQKLKMAQEGCNKALGFFPTPSKLVCVLTAIGKNQHEIQPKAVAVIFSVCQGRVPSAEPGVKSKVYKTLGECLSDDNAVKLINAELDKQPQKFPPIKIVHPQVLKVLPN
jgi:hypothetical protein